jgi:cell division protein FtsB
MSATRPQRRAPARGLVRGVRVPGVALATLALLVLATLVLAPSISTYLDQQQRIADLQARIATQKADLARLDAEQARWSDPAYIRAEAGSRLFYVMPGQRTYRVAGAGTAAAATPTPAKTAQPAQGDWKAALLGSLVAAGTSDAAPADLPTARLGG